MVKKTVILVILDMLEQLTGNVNRSRGVFLIFPAKRSKKKEFSQVRRAVPGTEMTPATAPPVKC
jgi:hypothetical protein